MNNYTELCAQGEAKSATEAKLAKAEEELHMMKTAGIIEVAVRNPSVADYMQHWEARAEAAEAKLAEVEWQRDQYHDICNQREEIIQARTARYESAEATVATLTAQVEAMRGALEKIASAEIRFDYVTFVRNADGTIDHEAPASPFDRGKAQAYAECQAIARAALTTENQNG